MEKPIEVGCLALVVGGHPGNLGRTVHVMGKTSNASNPTCTWVITRVDGGMLYAYDQRNRLDIVRMATADTASLMRWDEPGEFEETEESADDTPSTTETTTSLVSSAQ